jgi:hypothetical protein
MCAEYNPFYSPSELQEEIDEFLDYEFNEAYDETMEELAQELHVPEERLRDNNAIDEIVASYVDDNLTWSEVITNVTTFLTGGNN